MKLIDRTKANTYKVASSGAELVEGNLYHFGYINEQKRMIGSRGVVYKRLNDKEAIIKTKSEISYAEHFIDFGTVYGEEQDDNNLKEYLDIMIMNECSKCAWGIYIIICIRIIIIPKPFIQIRSINHIIYYYIIILYGSNQTSKYGTPFG